MAYQRNGSLLMLKEIYEKNHRSESFFIKHFGLCD